MLQDGAIDAQHVHVISQNFEVVIRVIAGGLAFVVQHRRFGIRFHGQMAAEQLVVQDVWHA